MPRSKSSAVPQVSAGQPDASTEDLAADFSFDFDPQPAQARVVEDSPSTSARHDPAWRHNTIGRHLHNAARVFDARVLEMLAEDGWEEVRLVHLTLTRALDFSGTRLTELAKRAAMTKQAMGELVDECAQLDLITRSADPTDGRAKIVTFTARGKRFMEAFRRAVLATQAEMVAQVGEACVEQMKRALDSYVTRAEARRSLLAGDEGEARASQLPARRAARAAPRGEPQLS